VKPTDLGMPPPPPPPSARTVFSPDRLELAQRYAELLASEGVVRGLIGPREGARLWDRHLLNCAVLGELVPHGASVCDIGSGAGLPGLVLAIARPDLTVTLVEPLLRRTTFLDEVVADLGMTAVEVHRGRADSLHDARTFDVVTSRAVAPLDRLLAWSMPLVAPTGALVAMKGSSAADEIAAADKVLRRLGCAIPEIHSVGATVTDSPSTAIRVAWAEPGRVGLPRPKASSGKKQRRRG
jgi:16S rRNA (guanine527-N7)-methyltransferase